MSEERVSEARRRLMDFAVRAVAVARTASAATSATATKAAATANVAAAKAKAVAATTAGRASASKNAGSADKRDETIARLEQEIEAERARAEELAGAAKAFEFKLEILEQSYGKQLADARADVDAAKRELSELKTLLADTRQELKRVTATKDRLHDMFAFDGRQIPPELRDKQPGDEDTIARLLAMANTMQDRGSTAGGSSREPPQSEPEAGELLSPELVFDSKDEKEENDDEQDDRKDVPG